MAFNPMNFVPKQGPAIPAVWLNQLDVLANSVLGGAITPAQARAALCLDAPLEIVNGGTGARDAAGGLANLGGFPISSFTGVNIGGQLWPRTPAEIAAGVTPANLTYPPGDVRRYGADSTGAADSGSAFAAAVSVGGSNVFIPPGTYKIGAAFTPLVPRCAMITGAGGLLLAGSVLQPQAGVTKLFSITSTGGNYPAIIGEFAIDGTATSNATGMVLGDGAGVHVTLLPVTIGNFTGGSGIGLKVADTLQTTIIAPYVYNCDTSCVISGDTRFPTTTKFISAEFDLSVTGPGCLITSGEGVEFDGCIFQSNKQEGVKIVPPASATLKGISFRKPWFENNWIGNTSGHYDVTVDGSGAGVVCIVDFDRPFFNSSGGSALCLNATGAAADVTIRAPQFASALANSIVFQSSAFGRIAAWDNFWSYSTIVSDAGGKVMGWDGPLITYSPTVTVAGGSAALSAITVNLARWRRVGVNMLLVEWNYTALISGAGGVYLQLPIPSGFTLQGTSVRLACLVTDAGTEQLGAVMTDGSTNLRMYKAGAVNYGSSGTVGSTGQAYLEVL